MAQTRALNDHLPREVELDFWPGLTPAALTAAFESGLLALRLRSEGAVPGPGSRVFVSVVRGPGRRVLKEETERDLSS